MNGSALAEGADAADSGDDCVVRFGPGKGPELESKLGAATRLVRESERGDEREQKHRSFAGRCLALVAFVAAVVYVRSRSSSSNSSSSSSMGRSHAGYGSGSSSIFSADAGAGGAGGMGSVE